ncbi:hypothetical protein [Duganella vulcania]|uniref:Uncharacterized protein n=1 Tax=Duganella vulcania TaxID=2692166 RepID=A0A845GIS4_9BURK|nr:hypothetical protein [Duganella vulcania]MYM92657.1 hypothetical protein [Duganella vulcania]
MDRISDAEFRAQDGTVSMKREYGSTPHGNPMAGRWVLRDAADVMLDFDRYANDLAERHALKLF